MAHAGIMGIGGVFFRSPDPPATAAWYRDKLGLPVRDDIAMLAWNDLPSTGSSVWAPFDENSEYFGDAQQPYMINFCVRGLDAFLETLRERGVEIFDADYRDDNGRFAWIRDCDGRRVELWEPPGS